MTERIVAVANEAAATGKQAEMVDTLLEAMSEQVAELGHVLTKVVRTATPDVNRRSTPRFAIKAKASFACPQGGEVSGELADISAGGARVVGLPRGPQGRCTLAIDDVRVPVEVVESRDGVCRVRIDGDRSQPVSEWIARRGAVERSAA